MSKRLTLFLLPLFAVLGCESGPEIKISAILPLTGEFEIYGQSVRKGVELAVAELAESDGSVPIVLNVVDTESDAEKAADLLGSEIGAGAFAAIGGVTSVEALAMVPVADRFDRVLLSPSASNPQLTGISRNFYRVFPSDTREGTTMAVFAAGKLQLEQVVLVAQEQPYARGVQEVFRSEFERNGGTVLEVIEYPAGGADFSGLLQRAVALEPDGIYLSAFADDIGAMVRELRSLGFKGRIMTTSAFSAVTPIEALGDLSEGLLLTQAAFDVGSEDPAIQSFVTRYNEVHGFAPDLYAAHGYDAVMVLARALADGKPASSDLWKSVRSIRDFTGVTGTIQFDERGDVQKFPRVYGVVEGDLIDYEAYVRDREERIRTRLRELEAERRRRGSSGS